MKKFLFALAVLATLPFSSSHCMDRETKMALVGLGTLAAGTAGYCYYNYYYKTPATTPNNPKENTPLQLAINRPDQTPMTIIQRRFPQDSAKIKAIFDEKNTTETVSGKVTGPVIVTEAPTTNVEPVAKTESCFLNNVRNSIEKMDLEKLLLENLDLLEG